MAERKLTNRDKQDPRLSDVRVIRQRMQDHIATAAAEALAMAHQRCVSPRSITVTLSDDLPTVVLGVRVEFWI